MATATVKVLHAVESLQAIEGEIASVMTANPETLLARRLDGVLEEVRRAIQRLQAMPADNAGATSHVTRAVKGLEALVKRGLIEASQEHGWLLRLVGASWLLARQAIVAATASGADPSVLARAETFVQRGDTQVTRGEFEAAAGQYEAAVGTLR